MVYGPPRLEVTWQLIIGTMAPMKVALFTDTYDEVNGVGNTFGNLTAYCRKAGRELEVYAHATDNRDSVARDGSVRILRYKPAAAIDIYFDMIFDLKISRWRICKEFRGQEYDLVQNGIRERL